MLRIGLARADITPRTDIEMSGFGKRIQPSLGVNDPLGATALVAADGETVIAAVDCDLLCVPADFTAEVRAQAEALAGIPARHVTVHCTHTHYGPRIPGADAGPGPERAYRESLIRQLVGLIRKAKSTMQPARMKIGLGKSDIGVNRREKTADGRVVLGVNPDGPVDRTVGVCRIETATGEPLAAVVSFATHPVGQDAQIRMISADYVGCTRRVVEEATGAPCLFWQGACGNINIVSAETDYAAACASGTKLGREVVRVWQIAEAVATDPVRTVTRAVELPPYRCLSREHAERQLEEARRTLEAARENPKSTPGLIDWFEKDVARVERLRDSWTHAAPAPPTVRAELQTFRIGDLAWACVPGELFNEIGTEIKKRSSFRHTFVVTYANNWIGYLPTPRAFEEGGYEVSQVCQVAPEAMGMMADHFAAMFREM
ncbi:MAG TPA: neutral/alkaline non-lysosomal ceramidase N-terminal domain-containing protein [Planctomycetota bacterium]|nr:neutral/alkaline non-lysosomal ceramidase N-terminal domain-containing protein [Planctomycetota bacterium]